MPFQLSPGVNVSEIDLTTIVPAVATTDAAFVGSFNWGPVDEITLVNNQETLVSTFGKPDLDTAEHWFTASNFLDYGNKLHTVRVVDSAVANNARSKRPALATFPTSHTGIWAARFPGSLGNNIRVSICDSYPGQFSNTGSLTVVSTRDSANTKDGSNIIKINSNTDFNIGDVITFRAASDNDIAVTLAEEPNTSGAVGWEQVTPSGEFKIVSFPEGLGSDNDPDNIPVKLHKAVPSTAYNVAIDRKWEFYNSFDQVPGTSVYAEARGSANDEIHVAVSDATGLITGTKGQVLETYPNVSKARDAKADDGSSNFYGEVINQKSKYIRWCAHPPTSGGQTAAAGTGGNDREWGSLAFTDGAQDVQSFEFIEGADDRGQTGVDLALSELWKPDTATLHFGADGYVDPSIPGPIMLGYDMFVDPEEIDISMILGGPHNGTVSKYIVESIAEKRKDCVAFISPRKDDVTNASHTLSQKTTAVKDYRLNQPGSEGINSLSSSYGVMDSGWKYQYDKFNDKYRWVPLNGDIAGLCVRTDESRDPWWSPAGFNRGHIKNVVRLAWNPQKAHRDELYKNGINPVVTIPGQGTVLFGDKTLQAKPSAFDRINVRRLFIVLEKAIATAAKFTLFEFNDEFTRSQFVNMVEPFLRDVQGRRGIYDFKVVCDESNNTGEVIDRNEFIGDIYIKPARSINFIQLNFVAVRTGVDFEEVVGKF
jgi:hypothetical protein